MCRSDATWAAPDVSQCENVAFVMLRENVSLQIKLVTFLPVNLLKCNKAWLNDTDVTRKDYGILLLIRGILLAVAFVR